MTEKISKIFFLLILALCSTVCSADDTGEANNNGNWQNYGGEQRNRNWNGNNNRNRSGNRNGSRNGNNRNRNRGERNGNRMNRGNFMELMPLMSSAPRIIAFETIRQKFPEESAKLDKIILETEEKYAELAKKSETELPVSIEVGLIKLRNADPAGYAEAFKAVKNDPRNGLRKLLELAKKHNIALTRQPRIGMKEGRNVQTPAANRNIQRPDFRKLRSKFPEEMKKYEAMRQENPTQARKLLTDMMQRLNGDSAKK